MCFTIYIRRITQIQTRMSLSVFISFNIDVISVIVFLILLCVTNLMLRVSLYTLLFPLQGSILLFLSALFLEWKQKQIFMKCGMQYCRHLFTDYLSSTQPTNLLQVLVFMTYFQIYFLITPNVIKCRVLYCVISAVMMLSQVKK